MFELHQAIQSDVLNVDYLKLSFVFMGFIDIMMLVIIISMIIKKMKDERQRLKYNVFFCAFLFIFVNVFFMLIIVDTANDLLKKNVLTIDKTVTVQNKVKTNNGSYWTFKHKGQTYKVDMSSMGGYSNDINVNNGDKITLKANDYFIKGHTINMNDVDYEIK